MQKLDPKAVWLFLLASLLSGIVPLIVILVFFPLFRLLALLFFIIYIPIRYWFAKLQYNNFGFELTRESIVIEKGVIWKKKSSIPFIKIQNVDIIRGPIVRLLGLSDLQIQTAGYSVYSGSDTFAVEGRLPGLSILQAEKLRETLLKEAKGVVV